MKAKVILRHLRDGIMKAALVLNTSELVREPDPSRFRTDAMDEMKRARLINCAQTPGSRASRVG